ncbi:MAG: hypothetical protein FD165_191 [Gammaproteobacteria bacterium]|nr:MAG: hypothetical protein FD165_191 [Gammaproteobacteria bacterium]TND06769.1 MAG: hypothetical protein FD120_501 [Gammaproteobacteria bacterium]
MRWHELFRCFVMLSAIASTTPAMAHFQMLIPSDDIVSQTENRQIQLDAMFWHPFEGLGMPMKMPARIGVRVRGNDIDLRDDLKPVSRHDRAGDMFDAFRVDYTLKRPGDHIFFVEPQPYWESNEELFIVHYTKVIVNAFGLESGWDEELGMPAEIVPLTRPYGLYAGNLFQGIVKVNGKPAPYTEVEVEYFNQDGKSSAPADPFITQIVKADGNGVFSYVMPRAGWWGFAALNRSALTMQHEGKDYPVEIGAVMWVKTYVME